MGSTPSFPLEYPINPLAVFSDPATYFPLLPRDIRQYVLTPYLLTGVTDEPIEGTWRTPHLVWSYAPEAPFRFQAFFVLQNGNFLIHVAAPRTRKARCSTQVTPEAGSLYLINPRRLSDPVQLFDGKIILVTNLKYITETDTLYLTIGHEVGWKVTKISTIQTKTSFLNSMERSSDRVAMWLGRKLGCHRVTYFMPKTYVRFYYQQQLLCHFVPEEPYDSCHYYGGYLFMLTPCQTKITVYACF